jgi:hypothetical protein
MLEELEPKITPLQVESKYGKFAVEPLERGFGHTLGNAFRHTDLDLVGQRNGFLTYARHNLLLVSAGRAQAPCQ